jgi:hypothetical protein
MIIQAIKNNILKIQLARRILENTASKITEPHTQEKLEVMLLEISDFENLSNSLLEKKVDKVNDIHQQRAIIQFVELIENYCLRIEQFAT